ncbi:MAG: extracellular solute-binding protein [Crenarchaeota archaeon]|nr:extracellular solute-binding protein [Thermoproteota archaeon]
MVAAAALFLARGGQQPAPQQEQPAAGQQPAAPGKPQLTGNLEEDALAIARYLSAKGVKEVRYTVWGVGDPNSVLRSLAVVEAAYRLNKLFQEKGVDFKITVAHEFRRGGGDQMADDFAKAFQSETNPDIMANSYKHVARFAEEGYILDITGYVEKYMDTELADYYKSLLDAVKYKGRYYGLPQDTEARPLYWRTDVAQCVKEKTGTDILADLYARVEKGEVTWHTVYQYAKAAKESGCSEWGVLHRKGSAHPDLIQFIYAFGGRLYDPETGKLVVDVPAVYKWLYVEWKMARDGLIPKDMMAWDWAKQIHPTVVCGKTLVWIGGTWHWTEWQTKPYCRDPQTGQERPLTAEEVKKLFYYTLFPAGDPGGKPVTLSQPFVWYIAANAGKDNPNYEELRDVYQMLAFLLVVKANDPDLVAIHSIISAHVPIREEAAKLIADKAWVDKLAKLEVDLSPDVKNAIKDIVEKTVNPINVEFLAEASKMLEYTRLTPVHPMYPALASIYADAVDKVLRGEMTPEEAIEYIKQKVNADPKLAEAVEIVGEIPRDWSFP